MADAENHAKSDTNKQYQYPPPKKKKKKKKNPEKIQTKQKTKPRNLHKTAFKENFDSFGMKMSKFRFKMDVKRWPGIFLCEIYLYYHDFMADGKNKTGAIRELSWNRHGSMFLWLHGSTETKCPSNLWIISFLHLLLHATSLSLNQQVLRTLSNKQGNGSGFARFWTWRSRPVRLALRSVEDKSKSWEINLATWIIITSYRDDTFHNPAVQIVKCVRDVFRHRSLAR